MATVDTRRGDNDFRAEVYLKFWSWDERHAVWMLNTRIDKPHADQKITSLAFSPEQGEGIPLQLVSAGEDGIVKVWRLRDRNLKNGEKEGEANCRSSASVLLIIVIRRVLGCADYLKVPL